MNFFSSSFFSAVFCWNIWTAVEKKEVQNESFVFHNEIQNRVGNTLKNFLSIIINVFLFKSTPFSLCFIQKELITDFFSPSDLNNSRSRATKDLRICEMWAFFASNSIHKLCFIIESNSIGSFIVMEKKWKISKVSIKEFLKRMLVQVLWVVTEYTFPPFAPLKNSFQ